MNSPTFKHLHCNFCPVSLPSNLQSESFSNLSKCSLAKHLTNLQSCFWKLPPTRTTGSWKQSRWGDINLLILFSSSILLIFKNEVSLNGNPWESFERFFCSIQKSSFVSIKILRLILFFATFFFLFLISCNC